MKDHDWTEALDYYYEMMEKPVDTATETEHQENRLVTMITHGNLNDYAEALAKTPQELTIERQAKELEALALRVQQLLTEKTDLNTKWNKAIDNAVATKFDLDTFKTKVRDYIIELHDSSDLDEQDAAEMLDNLELEGLKRKYTVTVTLTRTEDVEIEAVSEDDAYEKIQEKGAYDIFHQDFDGTADYFDVNVEHVSPTN